VCYSDGPGKGSFTFGNGDWIIKHQAAEMPPPPEDKVSLQNELFRLGGLPDEELQYEFSHRLKSVALLKKLANANSLPVARSAKRA
jgi:hypothetical protein